jgi:hypothetical protein
MGIMQKLNDIIKDLTSINKDLDYLDLDYLGLCQIINDLTEIHESLDDDFTEDELEIALEPKRIFDSRIRCAVAYKKENEYSMSFITLDGQPDHMIPILKEHYSDPEKALDLCNVGNLFVLKETLSGSISESIEESYFYKDCFPLHFDNFGHSRSYASNQYNHYLYCYHPDTQCWILHSL